MQKTTGTIRRNDELPYWSQNATRVEMYGSEQMMTIGRHGGGWQVTTSALQSKVAPIERSWRRMFSTFFMVHSAGWMPLLMAAFSAGRPKASKPMGKKTL